ncbi:MAG TPA: hypothetical protein VHB74_02555 [Devosia sp.]|nr:hypothetical protein [Devosia sp.]
MARSDTSPLKQKPFSLAWEGLASRLDAARPDLPMRQAEQRRQSHVRQMLVAAAMAGGGILAVAAVMMLGVL